MYFLRPETIFSRYPVYAKVHKRRMSETGLSFPGIYEGMEGADAWVPFV